MKKLSGSAVLRHQVFTLHDGSFVVQWDEKHVQELLSGRYREYDHRKDFGHPVTDYELKQLKQAGRVENHNRNYVWLYPLPEAGRFGQGHPRILDRGDRIRVYYLSSTLPKSQLSAVQTQLASLDLNDEFLARSRNSLVVILGKNGMPFRHLKDAEKAQKLLESKAPGMFTGLAVAFVETKSNANYAASSEEDIDATDLNLSELIASQTDTTVTAGKTVVLAVNQEDEREAFVNLFAAKMKLNVHNAKTGIEAIQLLEDSHPDLLITEIQLPDMHAWQLLNKVKEIGDLRDLSTIVITNEPTFGATVAKVEYLVRPVSIQRLRHNVWTVLKSRRTNYNPEPLS